MSVPALALVPASALALAAVAVRTLAWVLAHHMCPFRRSFG